MGAAPFTPLFFQIHHSPHIFLLILRRLNDPTPGWGWNQMQMRSWGWCVDWIESWAEWLLCVCQGANICSGNEWDTLHCVHCARCNNNALIFPSSVIDLLPRARIKDLFWTDNILLMSLIRLKRKKTLAINCGIQRCCRSIRFQFPVVLFISRDEYNSNAVLLNKLTCVLKVLRFLNERQWSRAS